MDIETAKEVSDYDHYTVSIRFEGEQLEKLRAVAEFQSVSYATAILVAVDILHDRLFNSSPTPGQAGKGDNDA